MWISADVTSIHIMQISSKQCIFREIIQYPQVAGKGLLAYNMHLSFILI